MEMGDQKQAKTGKHNRMKLELALPIPEVARLKSSFDEYPKMRPTSKDFETDWAVYKLYARWHFYIYKRSILFRNIDERFSMNERLDIFKKNARAVYEMNQMDPSCQFHLSAFCHTKDLFDWSGGEEMIPIPTDWDVKSDETVLDLYYRWCLNHKILRTPEEMQQRFSNFKMSAIHAFEMNQKNPSCLSEWCDKIELCNWSGVEDMTLTPTKGDLESKDALMELYHRWCLHHKIHRTPEEMQLRFSTFKNSVTNIFEMSQKDPTIQFCLSFGCDETDQPVPDVTVIPTERDLKSGNALLGLYHRYCLHYEIDMTPKEMKESFNDFKKGVHHVFEKNKKDPSCLFCLELFCDGKYLHEEPASKVFIGIRPTCWDIESDDALRVLYRRCCLHYDLRRTPEEMEERFNIFKEHAIRVFEMNRDSPEDSIAISLWCDETEFIGGVVVCSNDEEGYSSESCSSDEEGYSSES